ncbi:MAG: tyrosine--tRNA ligase, partial [Candidatus Paceibacteria bacterium]
IERERLEERLRNNETLRIKFGMDPTNQTVHLGWAVPFWKLKEFQDLGHQIVLIVGDFTATIGDTSDKDSERPMLSKEEVQENMKDYLEQISTILDIEQCEVHYNSEWLSHLSFEEFAYLADIFSVAEMLDRDSFSKRYHNGARISLREFMYPLMQGYDSLVTNADVEVGGNDQYFNLIAGRRLQKAHDIPSQDIVTFELLEGIDGRKMSASYGNYIAITDSPSDMFGKTMALNDELIEHYFRLATGVSEEQIAHYREQLEHGANPRDIKLELATTLTRRYHGAKAAEKAKQEFLSVHSEHQMPQDMQEYRLEASMQDQPLFEVVAQVFNISKSEARRVIKEGGVKVDDTVIEDTHANLPEEHSVVIQKGKRHFVNVVKT